MNLLLIRHAMAAEPSLFAFSTADDDTRPLTDDMREAAAGLRRLVPRIDVLAASPLVRVGETAEIVARSPSDRRSSNRCWPPASRRRALRAWLAREPARSTAALVGHERTSGSARHGS
jgi:phosphohistidine phosphatase